MKRRASTPDAPAVSGLCIDRSSGVTSPPLQTLNAPEHGEAVWQARQAIATARHLVAAVAAEMERSSRAIERAGELGVKSPRRDDSGAS